jgi:hypothetical protein
VEKKHIKNFDSWNYIKKWLDKKNQDVFSIVRKFGGAMSV